MAYQKYKNKWGIITVSLLSSIIMTLIYGFFVVEGVHLFKLLKLFLIVISLHLPLIASYFFKWRYFMIVNLIGWFIIWIGSIYYLIEDNEGMKDLAIITWVTFSWFISQSIALIIQVYISFKERSKKPL